MRYLRIHTPFLRTLLLLILLLVGISFALSAFQQRDNGNIQLSPSRWSWAPAASFDEERSPETGWSINTPGTAIPTKAYWLRIPLPRSDWEDPHLMALNIGSFKLYDGKQIIHAYFIPTNRMNSAYHWKMIALPVPLPAYVDILVRYTGSAPVSASFAIGNKSDLLSEILHRDLDNLILGALFLFSGFVALGLYSTQRDRLYLYFALLTFSGGFAALIRNHLLQVIVDYPPLSYYHDACMPLGTFAFIGVLEHLFPNIHHRTIRFLRKTMLVYSVLTFIAAIFSVHWYYAYSLPLFAPLFVIVFLCVYWTIASAYRRKKDLESVWIMAGFTSLTTIAIIHMYRFVIIRFMPQWVFEKMIWTFRLPADLLFWGLFAFVVCLIRVIMYRYTAMNRQLTEFNRSLEHVVHTRTQQLLERTEQLEITHERLGSSMRENAEALAEAMILEERHRITGSIHDTVGHTLSATIIQLEAAKRLLSRDAILAEEKLEASQGLVRRGLEDIRQSVRLLREDASYYDLPGSIGALIRETERSEDCKIESHLEQFPVNLSTLQKRIVFQTLQEGLTYGLKHGQRPPSTFRFVVKSESDNIRMQLIHLNERGYVREQLGFGILSIAEQAARIGSTITAAAGSEGFVLTLSLPLTRADHWVI